MRNRVIYAPQHTQSTHIQLFSNQIIIFSLISLPCLPYHNAIALLSFWTPIQNLTTHPRSHAPALRHYPAYAVSYVVILSEQSTTHVILSEQSTTHVILSEQSESKDIRTD